MLIFHIYKQLEVLKAFSFLHYSSNYKLSRPLTNFPIIVSIAERLLNNRFVIVGAPRDTAIAPLPRPECNRNKRGDPKTIMPGFLIPAAAWPPFPLTEQKAGARWQSVDEKALHGAKASLFIFHAGVYCEGAFGSCVISAVLAIVSLN